ncbi:MAG: 30S ribosome-binding factor RbfA [Candidatus Coatesbacteria bacterium]|nr:MAG: 30S ribosome-binding factor RbfA [Candidatus Coatesbacteria bacterium]
MKDRAIMHTTYSRSDRVEHQLQREVCELLLRKVKDPRIKVVTVTSVKVTHDLRQARIYYTVPRQDQERSDEVQRGLNSATGFVRTSLGKRLRLRRVPEIHFIKDEIYEQALRVSESIVKLEKEDRENSDDD